jgi:hypothetical protein
VKVKIKIDPGIAGWAASREFKIKISLEGKGQLLS